MAFLQENLVPRIPLGGYAESVIDYITETFEGFFDVVQDGLDGFVSAFEALLNFPPELVMIAILAAIAFYFAGWKVAVFAVVGSLLIIVLYIW